MSSHDSPGTTPIEKHLETALEMADDDKAKYHLREAYQKCVTLSELSDHS
ncbi:hypothetical protein [Haloarcula laminariae]|nr:MULTISPECIES: hypothetical protein [Halomicroarcula]